MRLFIQHFPDDLRDQLKHEAINQGCAMWELVVAILREYFKK